MRLTYRLSVLLGVVLVIEALVLSSQADDGGRREPEATFEFRSEYPFSIGVAREPYSAFLASRYAVVGTVEPGGKGICLPVGAAWYARVLDDAIPDNELAGVLAEAKKRQVPGLSLFGCERITDQGIQPIADLPDLRYLDLGGCSLLTDQSMKVLSHLPHLTELGVMSDGITDTGITTLAHATSIRSLQLDETKITNNAMTLLAELRELRDLSIAHTAIDDDGLGKLAKVSWLEALNLESTPISDKGLNHLSALHLRQLILANTTVTDVGLRTIASQTSLEALYLNGCQGVTDRGLLGLGVNKRLQFVDVTKTRVTEAGARALHGVLPTCRVEGLDWERR
jgi:hypothetical protein